MTKLSSDLASPQTTKDSQTIASRTRSELHRSAPANNRPESFSSTLPPPAIPTAAWSTALQTTLDHPPAQLPYRLLAGGVVFFITFGLWAYVGKVEEVSSARGQLVPQGEVYTVMPVRQGKVSDILVQEGDRVEAGQVMFKLDDRLDRTEISQLEQALQAYQDQLRQTQELAEKTRLEIQTRQTSSEASTLAQTAAIDGAKTNVATAQSLINLMQGEITAHQERIQRLTSLKADGAISQEYVFDAEQALLARQQTMAQTHGDLQEELSAIRQLDAEQTQIQAEGQRYVLEARQSLQQLEVEITQLNASITQTETLLQKAYTQLNNTSLHAPVEGVVLALKIDNPNEVVQVGQAIAEVSPKGVPLVLSAKLANRDVGFVQEGMTARIKFDAYPYQDYGTVEGKVVTVAPDAIKDEALGEVYEVEIELLQNHLETEKGLKHFKPGQTATVDITIRQRRVIDILISPFKQLQKGGLNL
ncbi:HlyD family type I secretion periplasmic adaptor subunit [Leptothoe sp. PORK10 BA2]|uniref:HlyD family type I secretion periplasmic adaptor subunit n=1 Tax=Leptothoe sp. PORK10 BA2 TaxID=3110254 RepID=UPI002B2062CF|nr:HlyD family type I secretion periplasmic adaptor subunit [Leptothoe sp. PORK10 BA2]MEA5466588.1 HlyD family type I secretion periplasmic adaptor subunit [Leptothoe sp. PORK10 BA2]